MIEISIASQDQMKVIQDLAFRTWPSAYESILGKDQLGYMLDKFYSLESLEKQLADGHHFLLATDENKVPSGFASFSLTEKEGIFKLHKIYVLPEKQGFHIGHQLLETIFSLIKEQKAKALQLNVNRHNKAIHFYEKMGFSKIGLEDISIGNGYFMNDFILEKKL